MFGVHTCLFCICVILYLGRGLATSWSLIQGVLPSVNWSWNWKTEARAQGGCKAREKRTLHNTSFKSLFPTSHNTTVYPYKDQPVNVLWGTNRRLLRESNEIHKSALCSKTFYMLRSWCTYRINGHCAKGLEMFVISVFKRWSEMKRVEDH
jgi:hypothetical protein